MSCRFIDNDDGDSNLEFCSTIDDKDNDEISNVTIADAPEL